MLSNIGPIQQLSIYLRRSYRRWRHRTLHSRHSDSSKGPLQTQQPFEDFSSSSNKPLDYVIAFFLFLLSLAIRLHKIKHPNTVVFDELHFGRFVKRYRDGEYFFDIHPPLGKLILLLVSWKWANEPTLDYKNVSVPYGDTIYVPLRVTNALFGSGVAPVVYMICKEMKMQVAAALVPAVMQAVDMLVVIESRMILLEGQLMLFIALCFLCALKLWNAKKGTLRRWMFLLATALAGAAALSVKWTALATPALVAIVSATGIVFPKQGRLDIIEMVVAGVTAIIFYVSLFFIHFKLLPKSGDGDAFMLAPFQRILIGNKQFYDPDAPRPWFFNNFIWLNGEMFRANRRIKTKHPYQSAWYTWIVNHRGLLFHHKVIRNSGGKSERMYLIVNPAVSTVNLIGLVSFLFLILTPAIYLYLQQWRRSKKRIDKTSSAAPKVSMKDIMSPKGKRLLRFKQGLFFLSGYALNLLPYIEVSRCTFLYHFIPALFYSELLLTTIIDTLPRGRREIVASVVIAATLIAFWYWSPWIYATPLTEKGHQARMLWLTSWT